MILLLLHSVITPFVMSSFITAKWWAAIITSVPVFGMYSVNLVATELEMPFGDDDNDLPLQTFQEEMNMSLLMLIHERADLMPRTSPGTIMDFDELTAAVCEVDMNSVCNDEK